MEVILRNVPITLTDDNLKKELRPFINVLSIVDWTVDKPKRKNLAWVTFLRTADGTSFLKRHGKISAGLQGSNQQPSTALPTSNRRARDVPRLHILSTPIYVEESNRRVESLTLKHLRHEQYERQHKPSGGDDRPSGISCPVTAVSCGKIIFQEPRMELTYIQQTEFLMGGHAKFGRQCLIVTWEEETRMDIPYDTMQDFIADHKSQSITLVLVEPPKFYSKVSDHFNSIVKWERQTSCPRWNDHAKYVAHCLVYQLVPGSDYNLIIGRLKRQDILSLTLYNIAQECYPAGKIEDYAASMRAFEGKMQTFGTARATIIPFPILFQVQTLIWNNYLHPFNGIRVLDIIERTARDVPFNTRAPPFTTDGIKRLLPKIPYPTPGADPADLDPEHLMQSVIRGELDLRSQDPFRDNIYGPDLPQHQIWVFKAMVTPTRIILQGPDAESKNRVLRMFEKYSDHFLRVSFCDESGEDLLFNPKVRNDAIYDRYRKVLVEGIRIAGRHFSFLGFSHSSLRSHSTWFLAPFVDADLRRQDHDTILTTLGDFSSIRVPAKCAARIGQAFSETPYAVDIFRTNINARYIPDVKSADGKRVFSDGVGTISWNAMDEVWNVLPSKFAGSTCFQIRWAGIKGMLTLDPELRGKVICIRKESMMKFPSKDMEELGICDVASRPLRFVLNRQVIKILEDMGTSDDWFMALQAKVLKVLQDVTTTAVNTSTFLRQQDIGNALGLPSFIRQLDNMGIDYRRDRFLKSVVEHVVLRELRLLKHKARIPVDQGVTLFGIMDETGFLNENEVYITYDETQTRASGTPPLKDGPVLVTRSPALHPGDIQFVKMVTPPQSHTLRALQNCIVFSQKGSRDLPSQLSGGDLDGDLYNITWDPQAHPKRTFTPADYPRVTPIPLDRTVTRDDIADFFINFMKSDILGLIANRHQILADVRDEGTRDDACIQLAEMHSTAVDYSKTGIAVSLFDMPKAPRSRPDFLAPAPPVKVYDLGQIDHIADDGIDDGEDDGEDGMGRNKPRYHRSEKILGRLYRGIDEKKIWSEHIHRSIPMTGPSVWDQLKGTIRIELEPYGIMIRYISDSYLQQAWKIRNLYEDSITDNMWHYSGNPRSCLTEVEVFCGSVLNKRGTQTRQQRDASMRLKDETDRVMAWICDLIRDKNGGASADKPNYDYPTDNTGSSDDSYVSGQGNDVLQLCWACLVVACTNKDESEYRMKEEYHGTWELESFRVVAATCLLKELNALKSAEAARTAGRRTWNAAYGFGQMSLS